MKLNDAQGKEWIRSRCGEEVHDWVLALSHSRWLYLHKVLDQYGNINEPYLEYVIDWLNIYPSIARGDENGWIENQCHLVLQELYPASLPTDADIVGVCINEVKKRAAVLMHNRMPPMQPHDLIKYVAHESCGSKKETPEAARLRLTWQANRDSAFAAKYLDETIHYFESLAEPLRSAIANRLPTEIANVPIRPYRMLLVAYDGAGKRRDNSRVARILNVMGFVTKRHDRSQELVSGHYIDAIVSRVVSVLRANVQETLTKFAGELWADDQRTLGRQLQRLAKDFRLEYSNVQREFIRELCEDFVPVPKSQLFGQPVIALANQVDAYHRNVRLANSDKQRRRA